MRTDCLKRETMKNKSDVLIHAQTCVGRHCADEERNTRLVRVRLKMLQNLNELSAFFISDRMIRWHRLVSSQELYGLPCSHAQKTA